MNELDELNERIAELKGWIKLPPPAYPKWQRPTQNGVECAYTPFCWANDIDAAYELEDEIPKDQRYPYIRELVLIVAPAGNFYKLTEIYWRLTRATPEQRCRAWLAWMERRADIIT
jgi:hypothetical protein